MTTWKTSHRNGKGDWSFRKNWTNYKNYKNWKVRLGLSLLASQCFNKANKITKRVRKALGLNINNS